MGKMCAEGKHKPGVRFEQIEDQLLEDGEFKAEYEKLKPRYEVISQIVKARKAH